MTTPPLFLLESLPEGGPVIIAGAEGRHAATVKRLMVGELVLVGDGRGTVLTCEVSVVDRARVEAAILSRDVSPPPSPRVVVVQALIKGDRGELAVEMLTELGVDEIVPWSASRSIAQWRGERGTKALERWRGTVREATKQSRRPFAPLVAELASTRDVATRLAAATGLVLHEAATEPLAEMRLPSEGDVVVVVGPEGGVSDDELALFGHAGAAPARLGHPVVRASTAGAAALAALSLRLGRWK